MKSQKNIIIVEDNLLIASEIRKNLEQAGYYISKIFESGEELLSSISKLSPDLIIMDIMLKGKLNGIDTVRLIKKEFKIPFVFITAYSDRDTLQKARETGPFNYLIKPAGREELITTVELSLRESWKKDYTTACPALDHIENILVVTDKNGKILFFNTTAEKTAGTQDSSKPVDIGELLLNRIELVEAPDFIKKENLVSVRQKFSHAAKIRNEFQDWSECQLTVTPIHKVNEEIAGVLFSVRRKKIAENLIALKEALDRYETLLSNIKMPAIIFDVNGAIFYTNAHFCEISGWFKNEIKNKNFYETLLPDKTREMVIEIFSDSIKQHEKQLDIEYKIVDQSGNELKYHWHHLALYNKNNSPAGFLLLGEKSSR